MTPTEPLPASATRGKINDRWRLRMTPDRVAFHRDRPRWEAERLGHMRDALEAGDVVYDVGAECGDFTALYGTWGCRVVPIEPQPRYWPAIRAHLVANQVVPVGCVVGFATDEDSLNASVVRDEWPVEADGPVKPDVGFLHVVSDAKTPRHKIDTLASVLPAPNALTIDVEGAEYRVLAGAPKVLQVMRPKLWISVHTDEAWMAEHYPTEGWEAIAGLLEHHGYRWEVLAETHERFVYAEPKGSP